MEIMEIEQYLTRYSAREREIKEGGSHKRSVYQKYRTGGQENGKGKQVYLFEDEVFLEPQEQMGIYRQDRFEPVREHCHNYVEINYIWSGAYTQVINGKTEVCRKGTLCILDTATKHTVSEGTEDDILINILLREEFFEKVLEKQISETGILMQFLKDMATKEQKEAKYLRFETETHPQIRHIISFLLRETYSLYSGKEKMQEMYVTALFMELFRLYEHHGHAGEERDKGQQKIFRILKYIEEQEGNVTIQDAADYFGFSPKYLTMLLKEKTGKSFLAHVQEQKMNQARKLLAHTELSVSQVIAICGYKNEHFFYQKFKESAGMTPGQFREQNTIHRSFHD